MIMAEPSSVGFSAARLARIGPTMARWVDGGLLSGAITLVARHGRVVHLQPHGMADIASGRPMARDTIVRIYSMTKPITSVAALMLYEEGYYQLDDPVAAYLPEFKDTPVSMRADAGWEVVPQERPMTIWHLFTHTSGLMYPTGEDSPTAAAYREAFPGRLNVPVPLDAWAATLGRLPLAFQPGSAWRYSWAIDVLGYLIEVLSGQTLDVFLEERLFGPLAMVDTGFWVPPEKAGRLASVYAPAEPGYQREGQLRSERTPGLRVVDAAATSEYLARRPFLSGGGGLVSTVDDYYRFAQMLLNRGELDGVSILGRKTVELMTMNHLPTEMLAVNDWSTCRGCGFGLGVRVMMDVARSGRHGSVGSYGWDGLASTYFWIDPKEDLIAISLPQHLPNTGFPHAQDFKAAVYQALVD